MRAVAYIRVSSLSQVDGHSLDAQERLFKELCKNRNWESIRTYREEGRSAHVEAISRRPVFRQLLDDAVKGQFDVVIVHTLDRWSRNQRVMLESISILARSNVSLVSITENIDYSTPQGKLFTQMPGSFAEYFSGALANHVSKGLDQRAHEGKHTGGIPFGYESCWTGKKGNRKRKCDPEHPGGIHLHPKERWAVIRLFQRYAMGNTTLSQLAGWLNEQGFRTRNMHRLLDAVGNITSGPRLFTTASVRGILHNPFYTGKITHRGKLFLGLHEPLVSPDIYETVQITLKKNSGRSETLQVRPERHYLLKGIVRCAYCGMPMWAQTYKSGRPFYREHKASRSHGLCSGGGSITCSTIDSQITGLIEAIELGPRWLEEVLTIISLKDEVETINKKRQNAQEKLRRMAKAYIDGVFPDGEYYRQKKLLEMELESLVVPQADAAEEAGKLILDPPMLWAKANQEEKRKLLLTMLDAVYVDAKKTKSIIAIKPKPPFRPIFRVAATHTGSKIHIINEPWRGSSVFLVETGENQDASLRIEMGDPKLYTMGQKRSTKGEDIMEQRKMGNTDLRCSAIGFGTWEMSTTQYGDIDVNEASRAANDAIDLGITLFDTAEIYGPFHSEELLGKALGKRRKEITLVTKVGFNYDEEGKVTGRNSKYDNVTKRAEGCLKRLQTDVIDLLLIHWPDPDTPLEETMRALEDLKKSGKIRYYGVSNFNVAMLETCQQHGSLAANQVGYHMFDRRMEKEVLPYCLEHKIGFMAYGTLAFGLLTGAFTPETTFAENDWRSHGSAFGLPLFEREYFLKELEVGKRLAELAKGYGKSLAQLAIAWVLGNEAVSVALVGMRNEKELKENIVAVEWQLSPEIRAEIDRIFEEEGVSTNIDVPQQLYAQKR